MKGRKEGRMWLDATQPLFYYYHGFKCMFTFKQNVRARYKNGKIEITSAVFILVLLCLLLRLSRARIIPGTWQMLLSVNAFPPTYPLSINTCHFVTIADLFSPFGSSIQTVARSSQSRTNPLSSPPWTPFCIAGKLWVVFYWAISVRVCGKNARLCE